MQFLKIDFKFLSYDISEPLLLWLIGLFIFFSLIFGAVLYFLLKSFQKKGKEEEEKLKLLLRESELNALKNQVNPHFLFNALNSANSLIATKPDKAREMIVKLSEYMRYSLKDQDTKSVLESEFENINRYLDIEKCRFGDKMIIENDIDKRLLNVEVPNMILQPIYENAIKHGVYESSKPVNIKTVLSIKNEYALLEISNNYDEEFISRKGAAFGIQSTKERMELFYSNDGLFTFKKDKGIFIATFYFPLIISK